MHDSNWQCCSLPCCACCICRLLPGLVQGACLGLQHVHLRAQQTFNMPPAMLTFRLVRGSRQYTAVWLQERGVRVVGHISRGLPPVTLGWWAPIADLPSMLQVRVESLVYGDVPFKTKHV